MKKAILILFLLLLPCFSLADQTVTMTFTGDITVGGEKYPQTKPNSFTAFYQENGADYFLKNLQCLLANDDVTVVNFEGTLTDSELQENKKKQYRFRAPTSFVDVLTTSSVEVATLSNNHIMDFGKQGLKATKETLNNAKIQYSMCEEAAICDVRGIRIAVLSFYSSDYGRMKKVLPDWIQQLKKESHVNAVVVTLHLGTEYSKNHDSNQASMAHWAADSGADLVIMHHPHVVQGIEIQNNRYIFYSLGNFCFGGNYKVRALEAMVVQADLTFDDNGKYIGQQMRIYPCHISGTMPDSNFQPLLVSGEDAEAVIKLIQYDTKFELEPFSEETGCITQPFLPAK